MSKCLKNRDQEISDLKQQIEIIKYDLKILSINYDILKKVCKTDKYKIVYVCGFSIDAQRQDLEKDGYVLKEHFQQGTMELWVKKECPCQKSEDDEDEDEDCGE